MSGDEITVRLTEEQAGEAESVCRVLGISVSELIRRAIAADRTILVRPLSAKGSQR